MKSNLILAGLFLATLAGIGAESWIHTKFGVILPWERPRHITVCGHQYDMGGNPSSPESGARVLMLDATVLNMPIPLPELRETDMGLPYGGCPAQVVVRIRDQSVLYGAVQGGP